MNYPRHTLCYLKKGATPLSILPEQAYSLLTYWMNCQFPLIYTCQPKELKPGHVQLAFPFFDSSSAKKIRLSAHFDITAIREAIALPMLQQIFTQVTLKQNTDIRVYGSYGWQYLTQLDYVQDSSDLDLLITYQAQSLTELAELYHDLKQSLPLLRLDGEVRFPQLGDCSWLELIQPTSAPTILCKSAQQIELISREYLYDQVPTLLA